MVGCCTTTGDPRQGGLFCWSESKAIERQNNLKQSLGDEEQKTQIEQSESRQLETEREYKVDEYEKQKKMLDDLDNDLENIRYNISKMEADTEDKSKKKDHLMQELTRLEKEIKYIRNHPSIKQKQQRVRDLKKEVDKLLELSTVLP